MLERINWKVAVPATVIGLGVIVAGLSVGGFHKAAFSDALIGVGRLLVLSL